MKNAILFLPYIFLSQIFANTYSISGIVKDKVNKEPLIGANVYVEGTSIGSATNDKGLYTLSGLKEGSYSIKASYIGYKTFSDSVLISGQNKNVTLDFNLNYTTIEGNEVVVTAQAKGQMDAINKQLNAKSLVNIISSDRIQELPDANAAETVARVPGVSIRREGGEGNKVVIRGLSPKYNNITVNGVKLASTDNEDRSTDLSMISQYMLDGIEVTKAGTPDQDADVLGGTVNFLLKKAEPGFHGNIITQGMHNDLRNTYNDNKFVVDLSNRFFRDQFGVLMQVDLENRNRGSNEVGTGYYLQGATLDTANPLFLSSLNLNDWIRLNDRQNTLQVFDFNFPNGNISYSNLNSNIDKDITRYSQSYDLLRNNRFMSSSEGVNSINVLTESWKLNLSNEDLIFDAYHSFSNSVKSDNFYDFGFLEQDAYDSTVMDRSISFVQNVAKNNINNTNLNSYNLYRTISDEKERATGFDLKFNFRLNDYISGNIKVGSKMRTKNRTYDRHHEFGLINGTFFHEFVLDTINSVLGLQINHSANSRYVPLLSFVDEDYDGSKFFNGKYPFGAVADVNAMMVLYDLFREYFDKANAGSNGANASIDTDVLHQIHQTNSQMYDYRGEEKYSATYLMTDIDMGPKLNVIAGFRNETNLTNYFSKSSLDHALAHWIFVFDRTNHKRDNTYFLPALFLNYKPTSWLHIKFAQTNTLTRPDYTSIIPLLRANGQGKTVDWRNKSLEPGLSKNTDFSVSFHQDKLGLLTAGYFQKEIDGLIYSSGSRLFFEEDADDIDLASIYYKYRIMDYKLNNPNTVDLQGWELDYQTRLWYLPGVLSGLVLNANYTVASSKVQYPRTVIEGYFDWDLFVYVENNIDSTYTDKLIDQPNEIINVSIGYDYKGFSGRLSMLHNDNVLVATNFWPELRQNTDAYRRWDLSLKQSLPVEGLEMFLNASNLTEAVDVSRYRGVTSKGDNLKLEQYYGRTIDFGFRYAF